MDLVALFRNEPAGWEKEQSIRLEWLHKNYPAYYDIVRSGDIEASVLYGLSSNIDDSSIAESTRSSIWVNGHRIGSINYLQNREFKKFIAVFYGEKDSDSSSSGMNAFLLEYPQFKNNMGKYTWIKRE